MNNTAMTVTNSSAIAASVPDFVQYIDRCPQTTRAYVNNLRQFCAWMKFSGIQQPTRADIIRYRDWLTGEHDAIALDSVNGWRYRLDSNGNRQQISCKPTTCKAYLQAVKAFFAWLASEGLYPNVAANIHAPKVADVHRKDSLTAKDVRTIEGSIAASAAQKQTAAAASPKDKAGRQQRSSEQGKRLMAMYLLAVNAGLRTVEISRANIRDLELRDGKATLYVFGKGHTEADTAKPIAREVYDAIKDYIDSRTDNPAGNSPLFVSTGNRSKGKRIAPTTISTMLKQAMKEAGYDSERITAHSLRHTAGQSIMDITGSNIYRTQQYMRHANPKTTEIYLNHDRARQDAELAEQLYKFYHE